MINLTSNHINQYISLEHKMELTFKYLDYICNPYELEALVSGFNRDYYAIALFDAVINPHFSHRLAAILYYSLLLQNNQKYIKNVVKH